MPPEAARLRRLQRLEKVRAIAKQAALREAAEAEAVLVQLEGLAARTRAMAEDYRARRRMNDGLELRQLAAFVSGLSGVSAHTQNDAAQARQAADRKQQDLALAERRRAAVEDRARASRQALNQRGQPLVLGARRTVGTDFE